MTPNFKFPNVKKKIQQMSVCVKIVSSVGRKTVTTRASCGRPNSKYVVRLSLCFIHKALFRRFCASAKEKWHNNKRRHVGF